MAASELAAARVAQAVPQEAEPDAGSAAGAVVAAQPDAAVVAEQPDAAAVEQEAVVRVLPSAEVRVRPSAVQPAPAARPARSGMTKATETFQHARRAANPAALRSLSS